MYTKKLTLFFVLFGLGFSVFAQSGLWTDTEITGQTENKSGNVPVYVPNNARAVVLNPNFMEEILWQAEESEAVSVDVPLQFGGFETYEVSRVSNIFAENLHNKYHKSIRAFTGVKQGDPTTQIRMTLGYERYNAVIYRPDGNLDYVEYSPQVQNNTYFVYRRGDADIERVACQFKDNAASDFTGIQKAQGPTGQKSFRLQLTTSKSWSALHASDATTKAEVQAIIVGQINNILNPIYNRDFGVIFTNATIDESIFLANATGTSTPFSDESNSGIVLNENSVFCNQGQSSAFSNINNNNYDVGHAQVGANSGGVASGSSVCSPFTNVIPAMDGGSVVGESGITKAEGMSGIDYPLLNDFTVDYLAHELGHQFGCNHTYSTVETVSGCDTGEAAARYEVGSGTTIMAYVNVCSSANVYPDGKTRSDPFFHAHSIDEAITFLNSPDEDCSTSPGATNAADPVISLAASSMSIPKGTPFVLSATVTDTESSSIVAAWNQFDLAADNYDGGSLSAPMAATTDGPPLSTNTSGPLFRFQIPTAPDGSNKVSRIFPSNGQTGGTQAWEVLPTVARTLSFRLTARDNQSGTNFNQFGRTALATKTVTVTNDGPMAVTAPTTNQNVPGNSNVDVTFTGLPSSICSNVDIFLSLDGGATYNSTALVTNAANTGTVSVTIPDGTAETSNARILVQCATPSGELFGGCTAFQISPSFNVTESILPVEMSFFEVRLVNKNEAALQWQTETELNNSGFEVERSKDGISYKVIGFVRGQGNSEITATYEYSDKGLSAGRYYYRLKQIDNDGTSKYSQVRTIEVGILSETVSIHPNPAKDFLTLTGVTDSSYDVAVYDALGRLVKSYTALNNRIPVTELSSGLYYLTFTTGNATVVKKFMVEK